MGKTALVAGANGLVGSHLLQLLLQSENYDKVIVVVRKELGLHHPKFEQVITDFSDVSVLKITCDDVFCCLGTTIRNAGSKEVFYRVDHDIPLQLAQQTRAAGAKKYLLISALGANADSGFFYNRVKGILEKDLAAIGFETLVFVKPSMLLGDRKERRVGESIGKFVMQLFDPIIPKKYKAVHAAAVAQAMLNAADSGVTGLQIVNNEQIIETASNQK